MAGLLAGSEFAVIQQDIFTVDIYRAYADAFDIDQFINVFELAVFVPVADNGFCLAQPTPFSDSAISSALAEFTLTGCAAQAQMENKPVARSVSSDFIVIDFICTPFVCEDQNDFWLTRQCGTFTGYVFAGNKQWCKRRLLCRKFTSLRNLFASLMI